MGVSWTDRSSEEEVEFHFQHPHPLDATLWEYEGVWRLDVAWMNGGYEAGKRVEQHRWQWDGIDEAKAKSKASSAIKIILNGAMTEGEGPPR